MKKPIIIIGVVILLGLIAGGIYYFFERPLPPEQNQPESQATHPLCLSDNETVDYTIDWRQYTGPVVIVIKNKETKKEIYKFNIESVLYAAYPIQPRKCGVYALRAFNYDPKMSKQAPGYKDEIWYYSYDGKGESLFPLSIKDKSGNFHNFFSLEFKADFLEIYIALIKGYLGSADFATIIKEIETNNDVFSLSHQDIVGRYTDLIGVFGLEGWTQDSHYFWGRISYGTNVFGFFRIERDTWKVDIFPATERILGGAAFNLEYGYVTYDTGPGWIGIEEQAQQIYEDWRGAGKKVDFYLYNLFTQEKTLLATTDDPSWSFKPRWISDTELQYELPTGETKVYTIEQ